MNEQEYLKNKGIQDNPRIIDVNGQETDFYLQDLLKDYKQQLILSGVRLSLFNEVYDKFVECENDDEFTQYLNENTNEA